MSGDNVTVALPLFQEASGGASPTSPHQFQFKEIKAQSASSANEAWHSRLPKIHWSNIVRNTHYVCYGAFYEGEMWAVGIWSSPVAQNGFKDGKKILELRRLAISNNCPKNTATRMLSVMIKLIKRKFPDLTRLISYQDTEVHSGTIYKAGNWQPIKETDFISWSNRKRNPDQSKAKKIRWEYEL
jgi:hypothetical protein